jgi:signal transduction histidine kinase
MNRISERALRESGLAFFGAVAASFSHELNNVLATINELSGLLDDLALAGGRGRSLEPDRIRGIARRIGLQIERGQRQSKQLNQFAHSVDSPWGSVDAGQVAEETAALSERLARLSKIELQTSVPEHPIALETNPFLLRHLLWRCIELTVAGTERGGAVSVVVTGAPDSDSFQVDFRGSAARAGASVADQVAFASALAAALGGQLKDETAAADAPHFTVGLPRRFVRDGDVPAETTSGG